MTELFVEELTFDPGAEIPLHHHPVVESFVVLEGELTFRLGVETILVDGEHTVTIPPGTPHGVVNRGSAAARTLATSPYNHDEFFRSATTYLEGVPRD
ncbi:MAG: cupin domain-containing protein [Chloroflexota bacterium]